MLTRFCDPDDGVLLRKLPPLCWQNQGEGGGGGASSSGSGDGGNQGSGDVGAGDAGAASAGDAGAKGEGKEGEGKDGKDGKKGDEQYITPRQLQGVLDAHKRTSQAEFKKLEDKQSEQTKTLKAIADRLEALASPPKSGDDDKKRAEDTERAELKRQLAAVQDELKASKSRADEEARLRKDSEFQTAVKAALNKAGCINAEAAFLVIQPYLKDEEGRIFATVKSEFGEEDLELDPYIEREFSENILPQLFKGKMRAGSPAAGDAGGGKGFVFTKEQLLDNPELYAQDPEKARAALEAGQVKGVPKPGQAHIQ